MPRPRITPIVGRRVIPPSGATTTSLRQGLEKVIADGVRFAADYPPKPSHSQYIRTRTLGRSWDRKVETSGILLVGVVFSNGNIAPYNLWVQGPRQRDFHQVTGWHSIDDIADHMEGIMRREMPDSIFRPIGK